MSPRRFTQAQLMTCLVLRAYFKTTYRGIIEILEASRELQERMGLERIPNYSTLKKFADRIASPDLVDALLGEILRQVDAPAGEVALDATGLESTTASAHYQARRGQHRHQYVKLSLAVICTTLLAAGLVVSWGPTNDKAQARELLAQDGGKSQARLAVRPCGLRRRMGASGLPRGMEHQEPDSACGPPRRWHGGWILACANDRSSQTLWQTMARRILHERTQTDHGFHIGGPIPARAVHRGRSPRAGLRPAALEGRRIMKGLQQSKLDSKISQSRECIW
jgi:hypothetical protein